MIGQKLADIKPVIIAKPEFVQRHFPAENSLNQIRQLEKLPAISYSRKGFVRDEVKFLDTNGQIQVQELNAFYRVNDADLIMAAVRAGQGYAVVMDCMVRQQLKEGSLVQLFSEYQLTDEGGVYAVYPSRQLSPGARLFVERLKLSFESI